MQDLFATRAVVLAAGANSITSGTAQLSNLNGVTFGINGQTVTASVAGGGGAAISAGTQSVSSGTVILSNSNGVTFGMAGSQTITVSVAMTALNLSAGTTSNNLSAAVLSNSNNVSFGLNGSTVTATATVASTQGSINVSAGTTSNLASAFTFSNANGVSFGLDASTLTASVATSLTNVRVSAGTTSNLLSAITFSNANNISFGLDASTLTGSVATSLTNIRVSAGTTSNLLSAITFSNAGGVSFGLDASTITATVATSLTNMRVSAGTTSNLLSAVTFSDSNGVSFGINASTVTASIATSLTNIRISAGTTSNLLSAVTFSNLNGITFGLNASTLTGSVVQVSASNAIQDVNTATNAGTGVTQFAAHDHVHRGVVGIDVNGIASTFYGTAQLSAGALISLATGGNSTRGSFQVVNLLSSATTASRVESANVIGAMASRFALEGHQHAGLWQISVGGNTAGGNTSAGAGSFALAGGPNITLSGATAAGGMTLSVSAAAPGTGAGVQAISAPSGSANNTVVFTGVQGLSATINGSTVSHGMTPVSYWENCQVMHANAAATNSGAVNVSLQRLWLPNPMTVTRLDFLGHLTVAGSTADSTTMRVAFYTRNASSLSMASSTSQTITFASGTNSTAGTNYGAYSGTRWRTVPLATLTLSVGEYWVGFINSVNGPAGTTGSMSVYGWSSVSVLNDTGSTRAISDHFAHGLFSAASASFPASIGLSGLLQSNGSCLRQPYFKLLGSWA